MSSENNKAESKNRHSFWYYLYRSHLYPSKGEALFKAFILSLSWVGGFWSSASVTAYYLFSISIIMEYAVQLVKAEKLPPKVWPLALVISNSCVALASSGQLFNGATQTFQFQYIVEILTMVVIWIDVLTTLVIEKPEECKIEDSLSRYVTVPNQN